jgi:hypothetical protein
MYHAALFPRLPLLVREHSSVVYRVTQELYLGPQSMKRLFTQPIWKGVLLLAFVALSVTGVVLFRHGQTDQALLNNLLALQHPSTLSIGMYHGCAIHSDATLACWGSKSDDFSILPPPTGTFRHVSVSSSLEPGYACAISTDNSLLCWGKGLKRQPPRGQFIDVYLEDYSTKACAVRANGTVICWDNKPGADVENPSLGELVIHVLRNGEQTCGIHADNTFTCSPSEEINPTRSENATLKDISMEPNLDCAIRLDSTVECRGSNDYGQATAPEGTFTQISVTQAYVCGIRTDSTLACWGSDRWGMTNPPAGTFVAVDADVWHTCAIRTDGYLVCWGQSYAEKRPFWTLPAGPFKVNSD